MNQELEEVIALFVVSLIIFVTVIITLITQFPK